MPADLVRRIESTLGVQFSIIYGQTEALAGRDADEAGRQRGKTRRTPSVPVLPQTEMKVIDPETGATVPIGEAGELCCRGYLVMLGYFEMPDRTAETIDEDGWALHTGDLVTMDDRGLHDDHRPAEGHDHPRRREHLPAGDRGTAVRASPRSRMSRSVGLPDERWGEIVGAFVRDADPADPVSDAELHTYCRENLSPQKTPKAWYRVG